MVHVHETRPSVLAMATGSRSGSPSSLYRTSIWQLEPGRLWKAAVALSPRFTRSVIATGTAANGDASPLAARTGAAGPATVVDVRRGASARSSSPLEHAPN